jgi:hypothetical protein
VVVGGGVMDLAGHALAPVTSSFTTGASADTAQPTVVAVSPANGATGVAVTSSIVLTFSEAVFYHPFYLSTPGISFYSPRRQRNLCACFRPRVSFIYEDVVHPADDAPGPLLSQWHSPIWLPVPTLPAAEKNE